ncbi:MAG: helix-turn-helix domain-containing protein, partial [Oscillospiraceae bacterium]|nr:helix-turn-helix domain-containing protein [Oscillospiraceae bacterium]
MPDFCTVFKNLRKDNNLTQAELAKKLGVAPSTVGMYERGQREPDFETLEKIANYFSVNMNTLLGKENETDIASGSLGIKIPVLGKVAAGIPITAVENILDYEEISSEMASSGEYVALKIQGSSMEPRMFEGDVVIVRVQSSVEHGEVAVVMVDGSEATVKKVQFLSNGILLQPFNSLLKICTPKSPIWVSISAEDPLIPKPPMIRPFASFKGTPPPKI